MFYIGPFGIDSATVLAPMAGVADQPFRDLCAREGAGLVVNEMLTSDTRLWSTKKSTARLQWGAQRGPRTVQIAGSDPQQMAQAAQSSVAHGAQIVDINMGCPAKKVCNRAAGSALLKDEPLVQAILTAVVQAVAVPVTLKIRTGWDPAHKNAPRIAQMAQDIGIQALTIHGRTRACRFQGQAEYDTIAEVVQRVQIPVLANGDIDSPAKAQTVLRHTGAQAVMIGRAAQGNPWIFSTINAYLKFGQTRPAPSLQTVQTVILEHLEALHQFYGETQGCRIARKHFAWYLAAQMPGWAAELCANARRHFNTLTLKQQQIDAVQSFFEQLYQLEDQAA